MENFDSKYSIEKAILEKMGGDTNLPFDSTFSIQKAILGKLGGDTSKKFDSEYDVLLDILDKTTPGGGGGTVNNQDKTVEIITNGQSTVTADEGYTGLGTVTINTNVPIPTFKTQEKSQDVVANGPVVIAPDSGFDGLSKVTVNVNVPTGGAAKLPVYRRRREFVQGYDINSSTYQHEYFPNAKYSTFDELINSISSSSIVHISSVIVSDPSSYGFNGFDVISGNSNVKGVDLPAELLTNYPFSGNSNLTDCVIRYTVSNYGQANYNSIYSDNITIQVDLGADFYIDHSPNFDKGIDNSATWDFYGFFENQKQIYFSGNAWGYCKIFEMKNISVAFSERFANIVIPPLFMFDNGNNSNIYMDGYFDTISINDSRFYNNIDNAQYCDLGISPLRSSDTMLKWNLGNIIKLGNNSIGIGENDIVYVDSLPKQDLRLSSSSTQPNIDKDSLLRILIALPELTDDNYTCSIGATNLSKLTAEEIQIGTDKGWIIN